MILCSLALGFQRLVAGTLLPLFALGTSHSEPELLGRTAESHRSNAPLATNVVLPLQILCHSNSDGSLWHAVARPYIESMVARLNRVFAPAGVQFSWQPTDYLLIQNDVLNRNFDYNRDVLAEIPGHPTGPRQQGWGDTNGAKARIRALYPDKVCVLFLSGSRWELDKNLNRYVYKPATTSWGGKLADVALAGDGGAIVHEMGHYLGLHHLYPDGDYSNFESFRKAVLAHLEKGASVKEAMDAFDFDLQHGIRDTPPDPGPAFWSKFPNAVSVPVTVGLKDGSMLKYTIVRDPNNPMSAGRKGSIEQFSPDQRKVIRETAELKLKQIAEIGPQKLDELIKKRSQYRHRMGPNLLTDPKWEADVQIPLSFDGKTLEIKNSTDRKVNVSARLPKIDLTEYELSFEGFGDSVVLLGVPVRYKGKPDTRTSNLGPEWLRITRTFCVDKEGYPAVVFEVAPGTVRLRNIQFRRVNTDL